MNGIKVVGVFNLVKDADIKVTNGGRAVAHVRLANNRVFRSKGKEGLQKKAVFTQADIWGKQAEAFKSLTKKGDRVLIEGYLDQDTWNEGEGENAKMRSAHKLVVESFTLMPYQAKEEEAATAATAPESEEEVGS